MTMNQSSRVLSSVSLNTFYARFNHSCSPIDPTNLPIVAIYRELRLNKTLSGSLCHRRIYDLGAEPRLFDSERTLYDSFEFQQRLDVTIAEVNQDPYESVRVRTLLEGSNLFSRKTIQQFIMWRSSRKHERKSKSSKTSRRGRLHKFLLIHTYFHRSTKRGEMETKFRNRSSLHKY
jgi:hypothetical protein